MARETRPSKILTRMLLLERKEHPWGLDENVICARSTTMTLVLSTGSERKVASLHTDSVVLAHGISVMQWLHSVSSSVILLSEFPPHACFFLSLPWKAGCLGVLESEALCLVTGCTDTVDAIFFCISKWAVLRCHILWAWNNPHQI